jgi:hypothetical protein
VTSNPAGVADTIVFDLQVQEVVIGDTARLRFVARDVTGAVIPDVPLTWRSLTPNVATVSNDGLVTTLDIGEAEIEVEATIPGVSPALLIDSSHLGSTTLRRVRSRAKIFSVPIVVISPTSATMGVKDQKLFTARITNMNDIELRNRPETKWSSSSPGVATITSAGVATAVAKGSTTITATVSVGPSFNKTKTARLTVDDAPCDGLPLVPTLMATVNYDYTAAGTNNAGRVAAEYHGQIKATMTNPGWQAGIPTAYWTGPITGSASQVETVHDASNKETQRLEGAGAPVQAPSLSWMSVLVDLNTCKFKWTIEVAIDLKWTVNGKPQQPQPFSARLYGGQSRLLALGQSNLFPIGDELEFPGHALTWEFSHPNEDSFVPHGLATLLMTPTAAVGKAEVSFVITAVK